MKVVACYHIGVEVDVPKEKVQQILAMDISNLDKGDQFAALVNEFSPNIRRVFEDDEVDGEISGVYLGTEIDDDFHFHWIDDDFDEVIWEE